MKKDRRLWLGAILICLFQTTATGQVPVSKPHAFDDGTPLKVVLTSSKERVRLHETFVLEAKILNVSRWAVSIFGKLLWGYAGGFTLHISDRSGHSVEPVQYDDDMITPSVLGDPHYYVLLFPDQFLGITRKDVPRNLFRKPGTYSVFIEYQSPVPEYYVKAPNFWGREKGVIRSAPINIEVVPQ